MCNNIYMSVCFLAGRRVTQLWRYPRHQEGHSWFWLVFLQILYRCTYKYITCFAGTVRTSWPTRNTAFGRHRHRTSPPGDLDCEPQEWHAWIQQKVDLHHNPCLAQQDIHPEKPEDRRQALKVSLSHHMPSSFLNNYLVYMIRNENDNICLYRMNWSGDKTIDGGNCIIG